MDNSSLNQAQQNNQNSTNTQAVKPIQDVNPSQPVGTLAKETAPISDYVRPTEHEPVLHPEVEKAGVEVKTEHPDIRFEHKQVGITHSVPPPLSEPAKKITYPMEEIEAKIELRKDKNPSNSKFWLAVSVLRQIFKGRGGK